jgi:hypothetical protein
LRTWSTSINFLWSYWSESAWADYLLEKNENIMLYILASFVFDELVAFVYD